MSLFKHLFMSLILLQPFQSTAMENTKFTPIQNFHDQSTGHKNELWQIFEENRIPDKSFHLFRTHHNLKEQAKLSAITLTGYRGLYDPSSSHFFKLGLSIQYKEQQQEDLTHNILYRLVDRNGSLNYSHFTYSFYNDNHVYAYINTNFRTQNNNQEIARLLSVLHSEGIINSSTINLLFRLFYHMNKDECAKIGHFYFNLTTIIRNINEKVMNNKERESFVGIAYKEFKNIEFYMTSVDYQTLKLSLAGHLISLKNAIYDATVVDLLASITYPSSFLISLENAHNYF